MQVYAFNTKKQVYWQIGECSYHRTIKMWPVDENQKHILTLIKKAIVKK